VTEGFDDVVMKFYTGYGDQKPFNKDGVDQGKIHVEGNEYLRYGGIILHTLCTSVLSKLAQAKRADVHAEALRRSDCTSSSSSLATACMHTVCASAASTAALPATAAA
jgi:hypothetical protein